MTSQQAESDFEVAAGAFIAAVSSATNYLAQEDEKIARLFLHELENHGLSLKNELSFAQMQQYESIVDRLQEASDRFLL